MIDFLIFFSRSAGAGFPLSCPLGGVGGEGAVGVGWGLTVRDDKLPGYLSNFFQMSDKKKLFLKI